MLDMDSSVSPTYGEQEIASRTAITNAPAIIRCFCSTSSAIWNVRAASRQRPQRQGWQSVLKPVIARYRGKVSRIYFRADAGFANPDVYDSSKPRGSSTRSDCPPTASSRTDRPLADAAGGSSAELSAAFLCELHLSGGKLDETPPRRRQGRMASGRILPARRLHRDEHRAAPRERHRLLQQARHMRAMDQGGQGRDQMDAAVMPLVRRQRRPSSASCARLQPRQLPAHAGDARADQDWSLTTLKEKLIKIGAKVVSHARYVAFQMAEVAIPKKPLRRHPAAHR